MAAYSSVALLPSPRPHHVSPTAATVYPGFHGHHHPCCDFLHDRLSPPSTPRIATLRSLLIASPSHHGASPIKSTPAIAPHLDDEDEEDSSSEFEFPVASPQCSFSCPYPVPLSCSPHHPNAFRNAGATSPQLDPELLFPLRLPPRLHSVGFGSTSPSRSSGGASPARSPQRRRTSSPLRGLALRSSSRATKDFDPFAAALVQIRKEALVDDIGGDGAESIQAQRNCRSRSLVGKLAGSRLTTAPSAMGSEDCGEERTQRDDLGLMAKQNSRPRSFFLRSASCTAPSNPFTSCLGWKRPRSP